ncbi:MAG: hypothetical protein ACI8QS_003758 [Planctomycetota bacterium]|jgi:hypothetical protein
MKDITYDQGRASRLLPLLGAIGREILERTQALDALELEFEELSTNQDNADSRYSDDRPATDRLSTSRLHSKMAEMAAHRRGLRHAQQELERLGCSVLGTEPLTFRIPGRVGEAKHSFVWQTGDLVLE